MSQRTVWVLFITVLGYAASHVHGRPVAVGCKHNAADIVFVLDESSSIWFKHFTEQLTFVESVVEDFQISEDMVRIGVMTFSDNAIVHFNLGDLTEEGEITTAISQIQQSNGDETQTAIALYRMHHEMFSSRYIRQGVPHIAVIITDGESIDPLSTIEEAATAHRQDIIVFAVGVGENVIQEELVAIASDPSYVYNVRSFDELQTLRETLALEACKIMIPSSATTTTTTTTTTTQPTMESLQNVKCRPADVIFAAPDEVGISDNNVILNFIQQMLPDAEEFGPQGLQVGLTPRMCGDRAPIALNAHDTKDGFQRALERRRLTTSLITGQIEQIMLMMAEAGTSRQQREQVGILLVDNVSENIDAATDMSNQARDAGIDLIVIGIGPYADRGEVWQLAQQTGRHYYVNSYEELYQLQHEIKGNICIPPTRRCIYTLE